MIQSGPTLDAGDISEMESKLGASLPASYRAFLLRHNGGTPEPAYYRDRKLRTFHVVDDRVEEYVNLWGDIDNMHDDLPAGVIPVAYDESGDRICLALTGENRGRVYLWNSDGQAPAVNWKELFPTLFPGDGDDPYEFRPDDWPGHPDLKLIAEDFAGFLGSFHDDPDPDNEGGESE